MFHFFPPSFFPIFLDDPFQVSCDVKTIQPKKSITSWRRTELSSLTGSRSGRHCNVSTEKASEKFD